MKKLAKIGEYTLRSNIEDCIRDVFDCVNYLAGEELDVHSIDRNGHLRKIDINRAVANYIALRKEFVECTLDPHQYDYRVRNVISGIDYLHSKFEEIILRENRK